MQNQTSQTRTPGNDELIKVIETFMDGWNRHDMAAHVSVFAEDADFVDVNGLRMRGRQEIAEEQGRRHIQRFSTSEVKTLDVSTRFLRPDVAIVHHSWEMVGDTGHDAKGTPVRRGIFTFVMTRENGRWRFDAAHNTNIVVPMAAPETSPSASS